MQGKLYSPRIDHFHVLLGAKTQLVILLITQFLSIGWLHKLLEMRVQPVAAPRVLSIQISVLARSTNNAQNKAIDPNQSFLMLDQTVHAADNRTRFCDAYIA